MTQQQEDQCRNDCVEKLLFPKRIFNRPGLSHIDYRIGSYADFREALLRALNNDPVLAGWTHREADDPGIALLEGASILGDILTFYQELYANEAYLRTARWRESIERLVRLTGYLLSPGVGGKATFAIEVKDNDNLNKPVPVPQGFPFKAQVEGLEQAADFETLKEFEAIPALSRFNLYRPPFYGNIDTGVSRFSVGTSLLDKMELQLDVGDRLMLVDSPANPVTARQMAVIKDIGEKFGQTEITIEGKWQQGFAGQQIMAYKLDRSFRYLGYNGPDKLVEVQKGIAVETPVSFSRQVGPAPGIFLAYLAGVYYPLPGYNYLPLDQEVEDLSPGTTFLINLQLSSDAAGIGPTHFFERKVVGVSSETITRANVTAGTTVIQLEGYAALPNATPPLIYTDIRTVEFHQVAGGKFPLKVAMEPDYSLDAGNVSTLYFYGDADSYKKLDQRPIAFTVDDRVELSTGIVKNGYLTSDPQLQLRRLDLTAPLQSFSLADFPLENPSVDVLGNLVETDQGKSEKEVVLGNGDNSQKFQSFKLPKSPLTYHNQADETPPEVPELKIYVNDRLWQRASSFFAHGAKEEIYIVREDEEENSWIQFGDGKTGARLPSGIQNVKAIYRTGTGAYGALKENTNAQAGGKLDRLDKIHMPEPASGGAEREEGDNAREAAPGKTQGLGRLVSLKDFESEALAIPGVEKAMAQWEVTDKRSAVLLTLLMESGRDKEFAGVSDIINKYNICRGPQRFPVVTIQGKRFYIYIHAEFALDPSFKEGLVKDSIKEALGVVGDEGNGIEGEDGLFGLKKRRFGQDAYASRIEGIIQNVEGVLWARVLALAALGEADDPASLAVPGTPGFSKRIACGTQNIFCLYKDHLLLAVAKAETAGRC